VGTAKNNICRGCALGIPHECRSCAIFPPVHAGDLVDARPDCFMPLNLPNKVLKLKKLPHDDPTQPEAWVEIENNDGLWPRWKFYKVK